MTQSVPPHPAPNHCRPKRVCEPLLHSYLPFSMNSVVIFFFFFAVLLPSVIPKLPLMPTVRRFSIAWKLLLFHNSLPRTALHPYLKSFVFIFIFIFCPTSFWRDWFTFLGIWDPLPVFSYFVEVALHAELLMYLWEKVISLSYSSFILGLPWKKYLMHSCFTEAQGESKSQHCHVQLPSPIYSVYCSSWR